MSLRKIEEPGQPATPGTESAMREVRSVPANDNGPPGRAGPRRATLDPERNATPDGFPILDDPPLAPDMLIGVRAIAEFVLGKTDIAAIRQIYYVTEQTTSLPWFKFGGRTCARKSSIRAKFWSQERRAWGSQEQELLARTHVLLSSALPLMSSNDNGPDEQARLGAITAEAVTTIKQLLKGQIT
ncbi:hypothetical protein [Bradyrhizobium iriomotense]|nr:hypothetical protein [Bradyrhizobium iriomotense]